MAGEGAIIITGDGDGAIIGPVKCGAAITVEEPIGMGACGTEAIITGLAEAAGEASMTLGGAGARLSSPTPMRAKFESSRERGHGSKVNVDTLGVTTGFIA